MIEEKKYRILIGSILFQSALLGILVNTASVTWVAIQQDLNLSLSVYTNSLAIRSGTGVLLGSFISAIFFKVNKKIFFFADISIMAAGFLLWLIKPGSYFWYLSAVVQGLAFCTSSFVIPTVISDNYPGKIGTFTGIAMSASGVAGIIFSPLASSIIAKSTWKFQIITFSIITIIVGFVGASLIGKEIPNEEPKKEINNSNKNLDQKFQVKLFFAEVLIMLGAVVTANETSTVTTMLRMAGYNNIAIFNSLVMIGNVSGKFLFGFISDRIGVWKALSIGYFFVTLSIISFMFFSENFIIMCVSSLILGFIIGIYMVGISNSSLAMFGQRGIKKHIGPLVSTCSAFSLISLFAFGKIVDITKSYNIYHYICITLCIISIIVSNVVRLHLKKQS